MEKKPDTTFSQWLVLLSVPLTILAATGLFRMLFDHEARMVRLEARCGKTEVTQRQPATESKPPNFGAGGAELAEPQVPFLRWAYRLGTWLFAKDTKR